MRTLNKIILYILTSLFFLMGLQLNIYSETYPVRLKDIAKIIEARDNQLLGYGIVVGLRNTGDSRSFVLANQALRNMLSKMGVNLGAGFNSRNIASVMVTATLEPFVKKGQRIQVVVSSLGDSTNLSGGTLLFTPLMGADLETYAVAQGTVLVGGFKEQSSSTQVIRNHTTVGVVPGGAIVEREVPITFVDQHNITIVLNDSNFITVSRAVDSIRETGYPGAQAIDANTIKIPLSDLQSADLVTTIAKLEDIKLKPDASAKIVIDSRSGTVVIGEMVRMFPVALTHGNISVRISENSGGVNLANQEGGALDVDIEEGDSQIYYLNPSSTLTSLVNSLNELGVTPKDLISIIRVLKQSGALIANIEVI